VDAISGELSALAQPPKLFSATDSRNRRILHTGVPVPASHLLP
jgi:hypothetical protein